MTKSFKIGTFTIHGFKQIPNINIDATNFQIKNNNLKGIIYFLENPNIGHYDIIGSNADNFALHYSSVSNKLYDNNVSAVYFEIPNDSLRLNPQIKPGGVTLDLHVENLQVINLNNQIFGMYFSVEPIYETGEGYLKITVDKDSLDNQYKWGGVNNPFRLGLVFGGDLDITYDDSSTNVSLSNSTPCDINLYYVVSTSTTYKSLHPGSTTGINL